MHGRNRTDYVTTIGSIHEGLFITRCFAPPKRHAMISAIRTRPYPFHCTINVGDGLAYRSRLPDRIGKTLGRPP